MRTFTMSLCLFASVGLVGCGGGNPIGAPQVKPPVAAVTPAGLLASVLTVSRTSKMNAMSAEFCVEDTIAKKVKCRLFSDGPTEILSILQDIDDRMAEIDERAQDSKRACLDGAPVDKTEDFAFPGALGATETFAHHLQCYDVFSDNTGWMAFGKKDNVWYLREGWSGAAGTEGVNKGIGKVVKIDADQNVEGWIMIGLDPATASESTVLLHLKTNKAAGTIEFTAGGENTGFDTVHFKSNATHIYVKDDDGESCLNAATYVDAAAQTECDALEGSLELATLGCKGGTGCVGGATTANNVDLTTLFEMGKKPITGVASF